MLLLDTHAWIWTVQGDAQRIGRRARSLIARAESRDAVRVSPATIFEIAALHTAGRLRLSCPLQAWIDDSLGQPGVRLADLSGRIAVDAGSIPRAALPDPLDRLLVATARALGAILLTADRAILLYAARTDNVRVHDAAG